MRYKLSYQRAFFKNDLYHFAAHDPRRINQTQKAQPKKKQQEEEKIIERPIDEKLTIQIPNEDSQAKEQLDLCEMLKGFKKKKDKKSQEATAEKEKTQETILKSEVKEKKGLESQQVPTQKEDKSDVVISDEKKTQKDEKIETKKEQKKKVELNLNIFKNSHLIKKNLEEKPEPIDDNDESAKKTKLIENHKFFKKLQYQWKKEGYKAWQDEKRKEKEGEDKDKEKEGNQQVAEKQEQHEGDHKERKKNKKIKKSNNYVRLDLKRKYKDRFIGSLNANLRRFTKNGRLKPQFRKAANEVSLQDGQLYNSYVASLSKALCMDIDLEDSEGESESHLSSQDKIQEPNLPSSYSYEEMKEYLQAAFGFHDFREGQFQTISHIVEGRSVLFISETASGKSLTYIMSSMLLGGLSMVVSPLVSLILDQLAHLPPYLPAACISSLINRQQRDRIITLVKNGTIKLLFITPESLQTDFIYHLQDFPLMNFVCVDEAHSLSELSHNFRTSFLGLGQILQKHVKYRLGTPTILGLTATANPQTTESIRQKLNIPIQIRSKSCMNKNLYVTVSRQRGFQKYQSLITYLRQPQIQKCRGILIYTRTRKIMFEVFNFVTNSTSLNTAIYHGALSNKEKTETLQKFRSGTIKVVVATIALGMGLDFSHLQCVIHINMPKSIENYVQEIGRAGRRQRRAYCHLFLDDNDYITERNYIIADELEPQTLVSLYSKLQENSCKQEKIQTTIGSQKQQADLAIKRAALIIEHKGNQDVIEEQEVEEDQEEADEVPHKTIGGDCLRSQLYYIRIEKLTAASQLREEALLTLLLKIEAEMKNWDVRLRVLPTSSQMVKVSFFKKNEEELKKQSDFFRHLVAGCKKAKGTFYIPLIQKCNRMGLRPIQLLTTLYRISNSHTLRVQLEFPVYVWQFEGKRRFTEDDPIDQLIRNSFERLNSNSQLDQVLEQINKVQKTSLIKLNTLYTVGFLYSNLNMNSIITKKMLIPPTQPIPQNSISTQFDKYFRTDLRKFYKQLTTNKKQTNQEQLGQNLNQQQEELVYIPTTCIQEKEKPEIYDCIVMFLKNEINLDDVYNEFQRDEMRRNTFLKFQDGKAITKVLMGINSGQISWKIYGERSYWMLFKNKDYEELLEIVKELLQKYKNHYSIRGYE